MVRMLDLAAAKGFAAPGNVIGLAFVFVAVVAVVAIAVFSCSDGADESDARRKKKRRAQPVVIVYGGGGC
ncbi:hypothetical protein CFC21_025911 [Triticum aestivum]|uniref:Uncharacterized protein n=2 Tax=Triticum aestivum TaxID=4565 RepID=A0A3B6CEK3_WHEAT|nr:hypothetical protein CFC21_025911 [Triticum aestivum]